MAKLKVSISQAWDESRAVLARDGKLIASVALALLVLPGVVVNVLVPPPSNLAAAILALVAVAITLLITFTGQLSIVRLAMGPHLTVAEAIKHGASRALPFIGAFLIWVVPFLLIGFVPYGMIRDNPAQPPPVASVALFTLTLIGIFVAVRLLLLGPVASHETGGPLTILRRSWRLTGGNWWRLFGFLLLFAIGAMALIWAVRSVMGIAARLASGSMSPTSVADLVMIIVLEVLIAAIYVVLFVMQARIYVQLSGSSGADTRVPITGM